MKKKVRILKAEKPKVKQEVTEKLLMKKWEQNRDWNYSMNK